MYFITGQHIKRKMLRSNIYVQSWLKLHKSLGDIKTEDHLQTSSRLQDLEMVTRNQKMSDKLSLGIRIKRASLASFKYIDAWCQNTFV